MFKLSIRLRLLNLCPLVQSTNEMVSRLWSLMCGRCVCDRSDPVVLGPPPQVCRFRLLTKECKVCGATMGQPELYFCSVLCWKIELRMCVIWPSSKNYQNGNTRIWTRTLKITSQQNGGRLSSIRHRLAPIWRRKLSICGFHMKAMRQVVTQCLMSGSRGNYIKIWPLFVWITSINARRVTDSGLFSHP